MSGDPTLPNPGRGSLRAAMRRISRDHAMALGFVVLSFALAFVQRPGWATSDTKIDLHVDPVGFIEQVASVWTPSIDLGAVHGAQYGGYLWPMGPLFALLHSLGLGPWVAHRLWLGLLFALSAWGMLRLLDVLVGRPRGIAHLVGAALYVLNPYTVVFTGRTSITLLGYAALPWLLLVVYHGVRSVRCWREWRGWWWAAAFALILTSIGGGINGAVVGWMLVGPLVLLIYEPLIGSVRWRDSARFLVRVGVLGTLASLWWIAPLVVHARYGIDFLQFTEQPRTIWATNSAPEVLRLMAHWTSYVGLSFGGPEHAFFTEAGTLLFNPLVVGASLLLPALAVAGFIWTRRARYAPFFLFVLLVGAAIEVAAFPEGTPSRDAMEWIYRNIPLVRFMRTTQKAAPLVAIGTAGLLGLAAQIAWARLTALRGTRERRFALVAAPVAIAVLIALAALPLVRGTAVERQLTWERIPRAWVEAGSDLDRELPRNSRALVLPGQIFAYYDWGGTVDPILPRVTDRPVAVRYETPYADPHATDVLWTVDRLVQQRRLVPAQLRPLLRLIGAGAVVTGDDDDTSRSGAVEPSAAAAELARQGLARPARSYGPTRSLPPLTGELGPSAELPQVRRYDLSAGRGIVGVAPIAPATIVDGGAEGLAGLAAFGALPERRPILYAADLSTGELRRHAARGADLVVSDSNRRRRFSPEFARQNLGATLRETEQLDPNFALIDPFPDRGSDSQTVATLDGAFYLRTPAGGGLLEFPERAPIAAFDGDLATTWTADRYVLPADRWVEIGFDRPRDIPYVDLYPTGDPFGIERGVDINGVRARLRPGRNRIPVRLEDVTALRVTITDVDQPPGELRGGGGFHEIRIPGLEVRQRLRPPLIAARALAGRDLRRVGVTYLFERTTADDPFRRDRQIGSPQLERPWNREDPERQIERVVFAPAPRSYALDAWVHPAVDARDSALDRIAGRKGPAISESSGRFKNQPRYRASSAFDDHPGTAWIGIWARPSAPHPWIAWRTRRPLSVSRLRLSPARSPIRRPTVVRLSWRGGTTPPLRVAADGTVALPRPARARGFRLTILGATFPTAATSRERSTRAIGIGSLTVPGLEPAGAPGSGRLRAACGSVRVQVGSREVALRPRGTVAALEAGEPLRASACGGSVRMGSGIQEIASLPGTFATHLLRLHSPAPVPLPPASGGGEVLDAGRIGNSSVDDVQVALSGPSWLILGQSFSEGWRATCDGRSLGEPRPINGYANGWRAPADCRNVAFDYTPQAGVNAAYVISGAVCLALLAFLIAGLLLRRPGRAVAAPLPPAPADRPQRVPLPRAAAIAFVATLPISFLFAARSSVVVFPLLTVILWRGVGSRLLTGVAAALLGVAVPIMYAIISPKDRGGYNFGYSRDLIWAHWVGVLAIILLMVVCWRALAAARRARTGAGHPPKSDLPPDPELEARGGLRPDLAGRTVR
jgi:arabinofuranan 3-O-arabinosyltransferase